VASPLVQPYLTQQNPCPGSGPRILGVADHQGHHNILKRAELSQQVVELKDKADPPIADDGQLSFVHSGEQLPPDAYFPACRPVQPAQQMEQRALAGPAGADHRHYLSDLHLEIDSLEDGELGPVAVEK
jgi:hypothetical protein